MLKRNLDNVLEQIAAVCRSCGRDPSDIVLVGVTKYSEAAIVREAVALGLTHIAENRVQTAKEKFVQLELTGVTRHLIGHLQSNKARDAVALFDLIQSVDSVGLLEEINKRAAALGKVQDILLQVDIAREEQKFGIAEDEVAGFCAHAIELKNVRLLGLMTMAPLTGDEVVIRTVFRRAKSIFDALRADPGNVYLRHLSMGMSGDFRIAIEEGSTMVRIGSLIFKA